MKQQTVELRIVYDETQNDPPCWWDWRTLLDVGDDTADVEVVSASRVTDFVAPPEEPADEPDLKLTPAPQSRDDNPQ